MTRDLGCLQHEEPAGLDGVLPEEQLHHAPVVLESRTEVVLGEESPPRGHARARGPGEHRHRVDEAAHALFRLRRVHPVHVFEQRPAEHVGLPLDSCDAGIGVVALRLRRRHGLQEFPPAQHSCVSMEGEQVVEQRCPASLEAGDVHDRRDRHSRDLRVLPQRLEDAQPPREVEHRPRSQEPAPELGEIGLLEIGGVRRQRAEEPGLSKVVESRILGRVSEEAVDCPGRVHHRHRPPSSVGPSYHLAIRAGRPREAWLPR